MSFNFSFAARTVYEARSKLHQVYAPATVKALVEQALNAIPAPDPQPMAETAQESTGRNSVSSLGIGRPISSSPSPPSPLIGVFVEAWGHIAEAGDKGTSEIQRFIVKPLFG